MEKLATRRLQSEGNVSTLKVQNLAVIVKNPPNVYMASENVGLRNASQVGSARITGENHFAENVKEVGFANTIVKFNSVKIAKDLGFAVTGNRNILVKLARVLKSVFTARTNEFAKNVMDEIFVIMTLESMVVKFAQFLASLMVLNTAFVAC